MSSEIVIIKGERPARVPTFIGAADTELPEDWLVFNAPRPIFGAISWEGEYQHGRFYAALNPALRTTPTLVARNESLDAWHVEWFTLEAATDWLVNYLISSQPDSVHGGIPAEEWFRKVIPEYPPAKIWGAFDYQYHRSQRRYFLYWCAALPGEMLVRDDLGKFFTDKGPETPGLIWEKRNGPFETRDAAEAAAPAGTRFG